MDGTSRWQLSQSVCKRAAFKTGETSGRPQLDAVRPHASIKRWSFCRESLPTVGLRPGYQSGLTCTSPAAVTGPLRGSHSSLCPSVIVAGSHVMT